jgi:hypothetical protein
MELVKIFEKFLDKNKKVRLIVAGNGDCTRVAEVAQKYWSKITFTGNLTSMTHHFDPYFDLQLLGLKTVLSNAHNKNTEKLLQDYLTFIPDLGDFGNLDVSVLKGKFKDNIQPLVTIANHNGFEFL